MKTNYILAMDKSHAEACVAGFNVDPVNLQNKSFSTGS